MARAGFHALCGITQPTDGTEQQGRQQESKRSCAFVCTLRTITQKSSSTSNVI